MSWILPEIKLPSGNVRTVIHLHDDSEPRTKTQREQNALYKRRQYYKNLAENQSRARERARLKAKRGQRI